MGVSTERHSSVCAAGQSKNRAVQSEVLKAARRLCSVSSVREAQGGSIYTHYIQGPLEETPGSGWKRVRRAFLQEASLCGGRPRSSEEMVAKALPCGTAGSPGLASYSCTRTSSSQQPFSNTTCSIMTADVRRPLECYE